MAHTGADRPSHATSQPPLADGIGGLYIKHRMGVEEKMFD
jgi:hypothetical protein